MTEIALYDTLRKIPEVSDAEAKEAVADIANSREVATKADIAELKAETKADIAELKAETKADITELKADNRAMKWMLGSLLVINVAIIMSVVSLLVRFA